MSDDWRVVFQSHSPALCQERALVLAAVDIPHSIVHDETGCALIVPAAASAAAVRELALYDDENPPAVRVTRRRIPHHNAMPGIVGYVFVVCAVAFLAATAAFSENWLAAGRVDGAAIRGGEWWRLFTALTLHSGPSHLAGNLVFGTVFGLFAGRLLGSGVAWALIVLCAGVGNLMNTLLLESLHKSIGASTAVFAALGLVAGFVWRAKLMSQERWPYRLGPIVGGLALLMYTGTGDANTDVGAHLMGFVSGFVGGVLAVRLIGVLTDRRLQRGGALTAVAIIVLAWIAALTNSAPPPIM